MRESSETLSRPRRDLGRRLLPFFAVMLLAVSIRVALLNRPFIPNDEGTATGIPVMHAVNLARYGPLAARLGGVLNTGWVDRRNWFIYAHHPPLVPLSIAAVYALAGISEWSTRAVPALFSLATAILLYAIAVRRFNWRVAFLAGLFYACSPITVAFGGMPDYVNGQVAFLMLATVEAYLRWRDTGRLSWLALTSILFLLGALSDWPIFYLAPILAGHYWLRTPRRGLAGAAALMVTACALFFALVLWANWAGADTSIFHQFAVRSFGSGGVTLRQWLEGVIVGHVASLHTWPVFILAVSYVGIRGSRLLRGSGIVRHEEAAILLLLTATLHLGVAIQGSFHSWWSVIVTAPLALAAALGLDTIVRGLDRRPRWQESIVVITAVLFVGLSGPTAYRQVTESYEHARSAGYTPRELGLVIRSVSRPEEGVATSDGLWDPTLWFYADRQLRPGVNTVSKLRASLSAGPYWLAFGYNQPDGPAPRWFVMPPPHRQALTSLTAELGARFPHRDVNGYAVYKLH